MKEEMRKSLNLLEKKNKDILIILDSIKKNRHYLNIFLLSLTLCSFIVCGPCILLKKKQDGLCPKQSSSNENKAIN